MCSVGEGEKIQNHPISHDIRYFPELLSQMIAIIPIWIMVLDKEYDAEPIYKIIQDENILSMIPTRNKDCLISRTKGRYRKQTRRKFDSTSILSLYHQRNKCETIFLVIKRRFGSKIKSYNYSMK